MSMRNHPTVGSQQYGVKVFATRDILKGEQLYTSYNECSLGCGGNGDNSIQDTFVTQHIFSHMGFVEEYPRRYIFHCILDDPQLFLTFDIDQIQVDDDNDNNNKELVLNWRHSLPDMYQINWIKAHLKRLKDAEGTTTRPTFNSTVVL